MIELKTKQNYKPIYDRLLMVPKKPELTSDGKLEILIDGLLEQIEYANLPSFKDDEKGESISQNIYKDKTYTDKDIKKRRDRYVFDLLESKVTCDNTIAITAGALDMKVFNLAFSLIESRDFMPAKIVCHPMQYRWIRALPEFQEATMRDIITNSFFGHLGTADVHVSTQMKIGTIYVLPTAETLGMVHFNRNKVASRILDDACVVQIQEWSC